VNELSKTNPTSSNGVDRLNAERAWLNFANKQNIPLQIFRLSGIYSDRKNILVRLKSGKANIINKKNHFFSRIHVEDIANVLFKSLSNFKSSEIYNISDDKPSSSEEVILYGVKILNIEKPKSIKEKEIESEMLKNFYKESKKVSNKKMKSFFNYKLKFPTYVEGLDYIRNHLI
jgi:nucleoside-diphosphate-sugar epimerase